MFGKIFNAGADFARDGAKFDRLFDDLDRFRIGELEAMARNVPGHAPADLTYVIGDAVFSGNTLFMHDYVAARSDFTGGHSRPLFRSIRCPMAMPDETRLFHRHDYKAAGRSEGEASCQSPRPS